MRTTIATLVFCALVGVPCFAEGPSRWVPEHCRSEGADKRWNDAYRSGFRAIERGDLNFAESEMCAALLAARNFDARDWRFAETLDELGRIAFELRDFDLAERMEGAAIAEMLLAVGPHGDPLRELDRSEHAVIRPDCRSGIRAYTTRLGWIHERAEGRTTTDEIKTAPWRIFEVGYLPLDAALAHRLDWLVSQYLLQENLTAAEALGELQREILEE